MNYDAQRFIGYVNYLAHNFPADPALVSIRQEGAPQLDGDRVLFRYSGLFRIHPEVLRLLSQANACLGSLRPEVYQNTDRDARFAGATSLSFPVGIAFLDAEDNVAAFDSPTWVHMLLFDGGATDRSRVHMNLGQRLWGDPEERITTTVSIPSDLAGRIVRVVGMVGNGGYHLTRNGYTCRDNLCYSSAPLPLSEARFNVSEAEQRFATLFAPMLQSPDTFGTLDASQVGRFCVR